MLEHLKVVLRLLVDILIAVVGFVAIGIAARYLNVFVRWLESNDVPPLIVKVFDVTEYFLFALDILGFGFLVLMSFYKMGLAIWELRNSG